MKNFNRENPLFSLCGLNCGLCTMYLDHYCPGCGGGEGNQACKIAKCSIQRGKVEYCFQCGEFPCEYYSDIDEYDSFITHLNRRKDLARAEEIGTDQYMEIMSEKSAVLKHLLENYNAGRQKSFFCTAVNLLEQDDLRTVMSAIALETGSDTLTLKERSASAVKIFKDMGKQRGMELTLRRKPKKK